MQWLDIGRFSNLWCASGTWDTWRLLQHTHTSKQSSSPIDPFFTGLVQVSFSADLTPFFIWDSLSDISSRLHIILKYVDLLWSLSFSVQGCGATCCVHLPGPNNLQPEWKWAFPTSGTRSGGTLLWGWTYPEVTGTLTNMIKIYIKVSIRMCNEAFSQK